MRAQEFITEDKTASNRAVWSYIQKTHPPEESTPFLKDLVLKWPRYEFRTVPLSKLKIPPPYYPDDAEEQEERVDPYGRTLWVDYDYAGEVSAHNVDRLPIVVDPQGHIIDGNHRAWAAAELLNRDSIQAWVAVDKVAENFADGQVKGKSRPGRVKRSGASCKGSVTDLRARAKKYSGERGKMYHWCANMKSGKQKVKEVKLLSKVKGKGSEPGQLPKFGREITPDQEQRYLGQQVGKLGGYTIWRDWLGGQLSYHLFDPQTRRVVLTSFGSQYKGNANSYIIQGLYALPGNPVKAHQFYRALIRGLGLTLVSDRKQSPGGNRVWQRLEAYPDVEVYGFDTGTGEVMNFGAKDMEMYAVSSRATAGSREMQKTARDIRLVATAR